MTTDYVIGLRFRAANDYAVRSGFYTGWPNFHSARYSNPDRIVYGNLLLRDAVVDWRDVPAAQYGNPQSARSRFTGAHDYAKRQGYQHGFPNWHAADHGAGVVYGTQLIVPGTCQWRDVPAVELGLGTGDPTRYAMDYWFLGAHDYAVRRGFVGAMPNGHYAYRPDPAGFYTRWVCGVFLFPRGVAEWRDVRGRDLGLDDIYPPTPPEPKVRVPVPDLSGLSYDDARDAISRVGLAFEPVYPPNANLWDPNLKDQLIVTGQSPLARTQVDEGWAVYVIFGWRSMPSVGVSRVTLTNRHVNGRPIDVHVWRRDTNSWTDFGIVDVGQSVDITLDEGVMTMVVAVDSGLINCDGNDPANVNCRRWQQSFIGDREGPPVRADVF